MCDCLLLGELWWILLLLISKKHLSSFSVKKENVGCDMGRCNSFSMLGSNLHRSKIAWMYLHILISWIPDLWLKWHTLCELTGWSFIFAPSATTNWIPETLMHRTTNNPNNHMRMVDTTCYCWVIIEVSDWSRLSRIAPAVSAYPSAEWAVVLPARLELRMTITWSTAGH